MFPVVYLACTYSYFAIASLNFLCDSLHARHTPADRADQQCQRLIIIIPPCHQRETDFPTPFGLQICVCIAVTRLLTSAVPASPLTLLDS